MKTSRQYLIFNKAHYFQYDAQFQEIRQELRDNGITTHDTPHSYLFDIVEGSKQYDAVLQILDRAEKIDGTRIRIRYTVSYSEKELANAAYMDIRSIYAGITTIYDVFADSYIQYEHECKREGHLHEHAVQVKTPVVRKLPSWRPTRHFASDYDSAMVNLFCSGTAKEIIEANKLAGAEFRPVLDARTQQPAKDVYQLWPYECNDCLLPGKYIDDCWICETCGQKRYITTDGRAELLLRKELLPEGIDFLQTPPLVGAQVGRPLYIISNRAFHVLKKANITRGLVFTVLRVV